MNKVMSKFSVRNFEEIIETIHRFFPHLPRIIQKKLVTVLPYCVAVWGAMYIASGIMPIFSDASPLTSPFFIKITHTFVMNGILIRIAAILTGFILLFAFRSLQMKKQKGWDSVWFVSIFQIFFGLLFVKWYIFIFVVIVWYLLFEVKKEYNS